MSEERRRHPRVRPRRGEHLEVRVRVGRGFVTCDVLDISLGGLGLLGRGPLDQVDLGETLDVILRLPHQEPLSLTGVARRRGVDRPELLGLELVDLLAEVEAAIAAYVAERRREVGERGFHRYLRDEDK